MSPEPVSRLRVLIDARLRDGEPGGVQQVIVGLAAGLSRLDAPGEEYLFLVWKGHADWLRPFVRGACKIVEFRASTTKTIGRRLQQVLRQIGGGGVLPSPVMKPPAPDRAAAALAGDVVHFAMQRAFLTRTPSIYQPHDLQHVHLPQFFTEAARRGRDRVYRACCEQAASVVAMTAWGKQDLVAHLGVAAEKVAVVPWAPLLSEYPVPDAATVADVRRRHALPERFAFFPAQTYPHKNHLRLLGALSRLRDRGLEVPLVCSGRRNEFHRVIDERARSLGLEQQVRFLGFVPPVDITVLYRACRLVVFPSLFEGWGLPISDAFLAGVPVACSSLDCLAEQVGDAAVLFDPTDESDIARAIVEAWTNEELRAMVSARGLERVRGLSWDHTARTFRALYRKVAGRPEVSSE